MTQIAQQPFRLIDTGGSRSFEADDSFRKLAANSGAEIAVIIGSDIARGLAMIANEPIKVVLLEIQTENLAAYIPEDFGREGSHVLGFNRFRLGQAAATNLVEIVVQPATTEAVKAAAASLFHGAGLTTAFCNDRPGRIIDRLVRPLFNQALTALDEGLADADQLDHALKLGLGYRRGPIDLLAESGLDDHFRVSNALYKAIGDGDYLPARRAQTAHERRNREPCP